MSSETETLILDELRRLNEKIEALQKPRPDWVDINEAAEMMGRKDKRHLREQIINCTLPIKFREMNGRYRFSTASIERYLQTITA